MKGCRFCEVISSLLGKRLFMFLFKEKWKSVHKKRLEKYLHNLNLEIVGGLTKRGWTVHDIDVMGNHSKVVIFHQRLKKAGIQNPIHYCGTNKNHSHILCLWNGIRLIFGKNGY